MGDHSSLSEQSPLLLAYLDTYLLASERGFSSLHYACYNHFYTLIKELGTSLSGNNVFLVQARKVARQLFSQEGCSPYKLTILPWVQMPLWIVLSFALRDMTGVFPNKVPLNPEATVSFVSEGLLWFHDLTLPDPYFVLPVILALSNLLNIEVWVCMNRQ